ncbi:hypothetical protein BJY00DRAFT_244950 [Aspergillus carlsbadensis]|nr:hypothetical protein BJY00DRAFT_244950 [Aspergillus carlsbadensis]
MDALVTFGVALNVTQDWKLSSLLALFYSLWVKPYLKPLTVQATFLCQSAGFGLHHSEVNEFLESLFADEATDWSCSLAVRINRYQGPARSAVQVILKHKSLAHESPLRELPLRLLCSRLLGTHTINSHTFRVVPSYTGQQPDAVDKLFGGSLILMHLNTFLETAKSSQCSDEWKHLESEWMTHILHALKEFTDEYKEFSEFLPNALILEMCGLMDDPKLSKVAKILLDMLNACKSASEQKLKDCRKALRDIDVKNKVEVIQRTLIPLVSFGRSLNIITKGMRKCSHLQPLNQNL